MKRIKLAALAVVLALSGCATIGQPEFLVNVNSLASPSAATKKSYILLPGNKGVTRDDLQFQQYAQYVVRGLAAHGFIPAETVANANVAIVLSYGIGDPQSHQYSYSLPVYGQTGIASSSTYGTLSSYGNSSSYSGTTTYTPSYGVTGYTSETGSYTTFYRYAQITAYDFQRYLKTKEQQELWQTTVTSTGSSGDLRRVFPILIAAALPYIATDTGQQIHVKLYESDPSVEAIKLSTPPQQ